MPGLLAIIVFPLLVHALVIAQHFFKGGHRFVFGLGQRLLEFLFNFRVAAVFREGMQFDRV